MAKTLDDYPVCKNCSKIGHWFGKPIASGPDGVMFAKDTPTHLSVIDWEKEELADYPGDTTILPCEPCKCGCKVAEVFR